ncbi:MAG: hypothetical protein EAX90_02770 [Candidatus Heimdallarchaeota archaeon]|nr:hypothetical protein [Candidatus Heimdallarchaeota archaeon]
MIKEISNCNICGRVFPRDEMIAYTFPNGVKLVCRKCYNQLPPDPMKRIPYPGKERKPTDDFFPPVE